MSDGATGASLLAQRVDESGRVRCGSNSTRCRPNVNHYDEQVAFLQKDLAETDPLIEEHIDHDDTLRRKAARLRELKGAGPVLAATLLAYVPELGRNRVPPALGPDWGRTLCE